MLARPSNAFFHSYLTKLLSPHVSTGCCAGRMGLHVTPKRDSEWTRTCVHVDTESIGSKNIARRHRRDIRVPHFCKNVRLLFCEGRKAEERIVPRTSCIKEPCISTIKPQSISPCHCVRTDIKYERRQRKMSSRSLARSLTCKG